MPLDVLAPLPTISAWLEGLFEEVEEQTGANADAIYISELAVRLPVELRVENDAAAGPQLGISPPSQYIETSVMPVLHHFEVRLAANEPEE